MHGRDNFYGVPIAGLQRWFVLAAEFDVVMCPVIDERGVLRYLELLMIQDGKWASVRVTAEELRYQGDPGQAVQHYVGQLQATIDAIGTNMQAWI